MNFTLNIHDDYPYLVMADNRTHDRYRALSFLPIVCYDIGDDSRVSNTLYSRHLRKSLFMSKSKSFKEDNILL